MLCALPRKTVPRSALGLRSGVCVRPQTAPRQPRRWAMRLEAPGGQATGGHYRQARSTSECLRTMFRGCQCGGRSCWLVERPRDGHSKTPSQGSTPCSCKGCTVSFGTGNSGIPRWTLCSRGWVTPGGASRPRVRSGNRYFRIRAAVEVPLRRLLAAGLRALSGRFPSRGATELP